MAGVEDGLERRSRALGPCGQGMIFLILSPWKETGESWQKAGLALGIHGNDTRYSLYWISMIVRQINS